MRPARPPRRRRSALTTAQRGYHSRHQAARAAAIAAFRPGQECPRCHQPIVSLWITDRHGRTVSAVDLGHVDGTGKTLYQGLEHRFCSRSAGATLGNKLRGALRAQQTSGRRW